jgi:hypothetical protein
MAVGSEVKLVTVRARSGSSHERLDTGFFVSPGVAAREHLTMLRAGGVDVQRLGDLASVWQPMRFARAWAAPAEPGVEYLRPYVASSTCRRRTTGCPGTALNASTGSWCSRR